MKMEEVSLEEDLRIVVAQEATTIVDILCEQRINILQQIYALVEPRTLEDLQLLPNLRKIISGVVDYFKNSDQQKCQNFLNTIWQFCENIPLELDTKILSISGYSSGALVNNFLPDTENSPRSPKRACLDQVQLYTNAVKSFLQNKFEKVTKDIKKKVCLDKTWLCWRTQKYARIRDRSAKALEGEDVFPDHKESVEALLKKTGRVVMLSGQAGSGKTLLMHCLGHHWAQGSYPSIKLLFLLEFRQLNLVSQPLSLKELLFRFFLPFEEDDEQSEAVLNYVISKPEEICLIFDGYDEFGARFTDPEGLSGSVEPDQQLPLADLLSALCSFKILRGCTVLVTCRPRDAFDLFGSSSYSVAELIGFNQQHVKEYTEEYFHEKGNDIKERAVRLLMNSHHLLYMSYVPGLCHVCCVCLDYVLSRDKSQKAGTQLPTSLTQIYLHILSAFISRCQSSGSFDNHIPLLQRYRTQIALLSNLAMDGLESSRIVFSANDLSPELLNFGANAGILSRVDLTCADGSRSLGCAFTHLTMQEFMAALHLMTNPEITESQLRKKLNLKSRWTAKNDPKTVFTDSLHLYMCGLAAKACTLSLVLLVGSENARTFVQKRQETVLKILQHFVVSGRQTGPKIIELCRCAHEMQEFNLARDVGSRERFELRNIRLNPVDMDSLAFVTSSANQMVCLDFGACSMEPESLNIIPKCKKLDKLIFRGRKYDDKFSEALSGILPRIQSLKELNFISGGLTDIGAAILFKALECCPKITHLNVSDNYLTDESVRKITEMMAKLPDLTSLKLGKNNISRNGIFTLTEKILADENIKQVHTNGKKEINVLFIPDTPNNVSTDDLTSTEESKELIMNDWNLGCTNVPKLCKMFKGCSLTNLNLSHNSLGNKGIKKLLEHLSTLDTIPEINVSDNEVDMDGVVLLVNYLSIHRDLIKIEASHNGMKKLVLKFSCRRSDPFTQLTPEGSNVLHKKLSLTQCDIKPTSMNRLCQSLIRCPYLLDLDFSEGNLMDESIEVLIRFLPEISFLSLLDLSHTKISTDTALSLVQLFSDCQRTTTVELRPQGQSFIKFLQVQSEAATCKVTQYELSSTDLEKLCGVLEHCHHLTDLDLSSNFLKDEAMKIFVELLPKLQISSSVSLNDNSLTELGVLYLLSLINTCERVAAVEVSLGQEQKAVIHFLQQNFSGKTFSLRHCCFELSHLQSLVKILTTCPTLKLQISSCTVENQNLTFLLNSLASVNAVQTLELRNNTFNAEEVKYLVCKLCRGSQHRTIRIIEPWIKEEAAVGLVANCLELNPHIKDIRIEKTCLNISIESLASATALNENEDFSLSAVNSISFSDCEVDGQHLSSLQSTIRKFPSLQELQFSLLTMGPAGAEFLSSVLPSLKNLKTLRLDSKGATEDKAVIFALQYRPNHLERLSLSHYVIEDSGAQVLGQALQGLTRMRSLSILQCLRCTATGGNDLVHALVQFHSLEEIQLDSLELGEEGIACFAQGLQTMSSLKKISLNKIIKDSSEVLCLLASLHKLTELEDVELIGLRIDDKGIEEVVKHIPKWTRLRKINLSENRVSDDAGEMLVNALSRCTALQQINLSRNSLGCRFAVLLGQVLPSLSELSELDLSENQMGFQGCSSLSEGLVSMKALKKLYLTSIGTSDLVNFASCLKHCTSIEDISLAWNQCENDVALKLAEVIPQCRNLRRLDLEANMINTSGAKALAACLRSSPWIEVIRLWRNPINKDDASLQDKRLNFSST